MRVVAVTCVGAFLAASPAYAGGLGLLANGGVHTETVYFYSSADPEGNEYQDIDDYDQYKVNQTLSNLGLGVNLILGDRDDRIMGDFRFYWVADAAQKDPSTVDNRVEDDTVVASWRDETRHTGVAVVGLTWGIVGDPSKFLLNAVGHVGSGFITLDHSEYLVLDIGPGVSYRLNRQVQVFGDVVYQTRYRKDFTHSVLGTVGARYLFD